MLPKYNLLSLAVTLTAALYAGGAQAQQQPYLPTHAQMLETYKTADMLDSVVRRIPVVTNIAARWFKDNKGFWYAKRGKSGTEYYKADITAGKKSPLFERAKLVEAVGKTLNKTIAESSFKESNLHVADDAATIIFKFDSKWFAYNPATGNCGFSTDTAGASANANFRRWRGRRWGAVDSLSPDKKWISVIKDGNIFLKPVAGGSEIQFTTNGSSQKPYSGITWSPDGSYFVAYLTNPKKPEDVYYLLTSQPGTTRAVLKSHSYPQPGDDFTTYEQYIFKVADKSAVKTDADIINLNGEPMLRWRKGNNRYFSYEKTDRGHQRFRVIEVDSQTGKTRNIIDEQTKTFIYEQRIFTHYLPETREIVWVTEKDGWRHIYLVNDAAKKQQLVTPGEWVVRTVDSVDTKKRQIWFQASGKNKNEDPYFIHYYRINFDGKGLVDLTPEKGNHSVSFSPDKNYFVDTWSEVNVAPRLVVKRTSDARVMLELEQANLDELLATGLKLPEVFVAKGRDGKTDIWGVIYRPANMDPSKKYPIIENIYAGPQDSFVPKSFSAVNEMQSIAQLGFIVVQIDGMGTANRSKAFHDVCWHNIADAGFADRILWMKALAAKYPQADTGRVGVYGTSAGGQNSAGALLFHPEFYKAAVSACGCHDNRIDKQWWNEQWMGYPVEKHYDDQSNITNAAKLKGNLMLIVGEADTNVPPESTLRFADALIKSDKEFDLLVIPGMGHSDGGVWGRKRKRAFFVKHLLNADAPNQNINELKTR